MPRDWGRLDPAGKRRALVRAGLAETWEAAGRVLAKHCAAVRNHRRAKEERRQECLKRLNGRGGRGS